MRGTGTRQTAWIAFVALCGAAHVAAQQARPDTAVPVTPDARASGEVVAVRIEQARQVADRLRVFLFAHDRAGSPSRRVLDRAAVTAYVANRSVPVDSVRGFGEPGDGTAFLFLVDVSLSVAPAQFQQMRNALADWRRKLRSSDRAALIAFGSDVRVSSDFDADTTAFLNALAQLQPSDNRTRFHDALLRALEIARQSGSDLPARTIIVVLSDGVDDVVGAATRNEVIAALNAHRVPIYGIGFARPPVDAAERAGLQALGEFARLSGGRYLDGAGMPFDSLFARVHTIVSAVQVLDLDCSGCPDDGNVYRLSIDAMEGSRRLSDGMDVRLLPAAATRVAEPPPSSRAAQPGRVLWLSGAAAVAVLIVLGLLFRMRARAAQRSASAADDRAPMPADAPVWAVGAAGPVVQASAAVPIRIRVTPLVSSAPGASLVLAITDRTTLGRDPGQAQVAFREESSVSAVHCALSRQGERLFVEDLDSTNGTFLNGVPVRGRQPVQNEDVIRLGRFEVRLRVLSA